ncbi:hypothetical protein R0K18_36105, partial [Pantoea sp. SIMBA_133]
MFALASASASPALAAAPLRHLAAPLLLCLQAVQLALGVFGGLGIDLPDQRALEVDTLGAFPDR